MIIRQVESKDNVAWDEFVKESQSGTFFHMYNWLEVISKSYGHKSFSLIAEENSNIIGILPLVLIKSRVFGTKLVSTPYAPNGGPISNNCTVEKALVKEAINISNKLNVDYFEMRSSLSCENNEFDFKSDSLKVSSFLNLDSNPELVLMQTLNRNKRKSIYKSLKNNLSYEWTTDTSDFYRIFAENMKDLGSPFHSILFFDNIIKYFPSNSKVLVVKADSKVIYSAFYLFYKDKMINSWSSSVKEKRDLYPTDFGIWKAIEFGCKNGYKYYDFGRSQKDSSNYEFKRRWSATSEDLDYNYFLVKSSKIPNTTSSSKKRQIFASVWRKVPMPIVSVIGPILRKKVQ